MESKVIFRDYQEQQAQDHNDLQTFTERTFDHLVLDAVTAERRYAGFNVTKTGQTEIQIEPGRMYDVLGVIYAINTTTVQSMVSYLAPAYYRYILLTAVGNDVETDIEERDYLIDVTSGATEPRAVATTRARVAVLTFISGTPSGDPIKPAVPVGHVAVAYILVDPTQVVSIEMVENNKVTSTDSLDLRTDALELFAEIIGPKVAALAADLADLRNRLNQMGNQRLLMAVAQDVARVKASLRYNVTGAIDYSTEWFLDDIYSDTQDTHMQGYDCMIDEGLRFGYDNMDEWEIKLFSANDANAAYSNGLLLPKYEEVLRMATTTSTSPDLTLGIAQYGYQDIEMKQGFMSRTRLRYGDSFWVCSNSLQWDYNDVWGSTNRLVNAYGMNPIAPLYDENTGVTSTRMTMIGAQIYGAGLTINHELSRYDHYWLDTWNEPFMYAITVDHEIRGAFVAQTFLVANDIWATSLHFYVSAKGANENIHVALTELHAGVPDPEKTMVKVVHPEASIVVGWNKVMIPPTFMRKGAKYAMCLISNANHQVGMVSGQKYLDGTFFYSTDGVYYQGDLTKDLMMQVWGAYFNNSQVVIEFEPINLDGGFRNIDLLAEMWVPSSAKIIFEMKPNGVGEWQPLLQDNTDVLSIAPTMAYFRARFDGSRDMHGAIRLTGSRMRAWRPKTHLTHTSNGIVLASNCGTVLVTCVLEHFDEIPHDHTCKLLTGPTYTTIEDPDATVTKLTDALAGRWERVYTFNMSPAISQFLVLQTGATNSAQNTFHVAERTFLGLP